MNTLNSHCYQPRLQRQIGLSLIEIMVGLAVAMIASLAVIQAFSVSEGFRRNTAGSSDASQQGAILTNMLSSTFQNAGSGLSRTTLTWGCKLHAGAAAASYPLSATLAAPFNIVPTTVRVAPLLVFDGGADGTGRAKPDVIQLMAGSSENGNRWFEASIAISGANTNVVVNNALGYKGGDYILLVARTGLTDAPDDCQLTRVQAAYSPGYQVSNYGSDVVSSANTTLPVDTLAMGSVIASLTAPGVTPIILNQGQQASWSLYGVDTSGNLRVSDLLADPNVSQILAENVFMMKVLYGVDTNNDDVIDDWVQPKNAYAAAALAAGAATDEGRLAAILAVRVGVILRSNENQSGGSAPASLSLFSDLAATYSFTLTAAEQRFQYQTYDWIIPLRNIKRFQ